MSRKAVDRLNSGFMDSGLYIYIYILVMALATWFMRVASSLVMKKPITNRFFQSFLYYVPYVTLSVMTFPAIVEATQSPFAGAAALIVGIAAAWLGASLFKVAAICCLTVFVLESILL
jgi:branched-subunit amino acid transport protein